MLGGGGSPTGREAAAKVASLMTRRPCQRLCAGSGGIEEGFRQGENGRALRGWGHAGMVFGAEWGEGENELTRSEGMTPGVSAAAPISTRTRTPAGVGGVGGGVGGGLGVRFLNPFHVAYC